MASDVVRRFMEALQAAERTGEVGPLVGLFADDAELSRLGEAEPARGREGAGRELGSKMTKALDDREVVGPPIQVCGMGGRPKEHRRLPKRGGRDRIRHVP